MITVKTTAQVNDARQVVLQLPESLPPGEYDLVVVIGDKPLAKQQPRELPFAGYSFPINAGETFTREDLYGDDSR